MFVPRSLRVAKPPAAPSKPHAKPSPSPSTSSSSSPASSTPNSSTPPPKPLSTSFSLPLVNPIPDIDPTPSQKIAPLPSIPTASSLVTIHPVPDPQAKVIVNHTKGLLPSYDDEDDEEPTIPQQRTVPQVTSPVGPQAQGGEEEEDDGAVVMLSSQQRLPVPGEPVCVVCGRYGEYICDETEMDVCSMECKQKHLEEYQARQKEVALQAAFKLERTMFYKEHPDIECLSEQQINDIRREIQITIKGEDIPKPILEFGHCNFPEKLQANIMAEEYLTPTPIQMQTIPIALAQRDMMACAATGSGKTACFVLPALYQVLAHTPEVPEGTAPVYCPKPLVLILAPTRELCMQIEDQIKPLAMGLPVRTALVVGGLPMPNQVYRLKSNVQIIVATPGRLIDIMVKHPELECLSTVSMLILDEVDMMLQMGFETQVMQLVKSLPDHQTLLFSATIPPAIEKMSHTILENPVLVAVGSPSTPTSAVKQTMLWVENKAKKKKLFDLLEDPKYYHPPIVVFVDSKKGADMLAEAISLKTGISAVSIHGDKTQNERTDILKSFIQGTYPIIVSTAVLGRGLDLLRVDMVVNFDMPPSIQEYIHQIGRAGRLGRSGWAVTFVNNENKSIFVELVQMCQALKINIPNELLNSPFAKGESLKKKRQLDKKEEPVGLDAWKKEMTERKRRK